MELKYDELLSSFVFVLKLRPHSTVPALSVNRRVVMLRSSADVDCDFSWDLCAMGGAGIDGIVTVEPAKGVLPAGATLFFKVGPRRKMGTQHGDRWYSTQETRVGDVLKDV